MATHADSVVANGEPRSVLAINGGSSSVRFAVYDESKPLRQVLAGKLDRVGLSGTNFKFRDLSGQSHEESTIDAGDHR